MIRMKEDSPSNHLSGKLPILDLEVWIEEERIMNQFYKKTMTSRKLVQARTAFSTSKKRSILVEEGMRRLRNCSPNLCWTKKAYFLNVFTSDMKFSGHSTSFRATVLKKVLNKYLVEISNHLEGKKRMYRSRQERQTMKEASKVDKQRDTWFRAGGATSTLTVPATPDGILADEIRKNLCKGRQPQGTQTRVIEDGGRCSTAGLIRTNQFPREMCRRVDCLLCVQKDGDGENSRCESSNVGYEGECYRCTERHAYIGETSRTAFTRIKEHWGDYRAAAAAKIPPQPADSTEWMTNRRKKKPDVKSWMWEHTRDMHGGVVGENRGMKDFKFKVVSKFNKCLPRQVDEDVRMQKNEREGGVTLNSKNEYYTPKGVQPAFQQL